MNKQPLLMIRDRVGSKLPLGRMGVEGTVSGCMYRPMAGKVTRLGQNPGRGIIQKVDPDIPVEYPVQQLLLKEA